jgi:RNA polymerase sigma-70 factor, ECF subfamily
MDDLRGVVELFLAHLRPSVRPLLEGLPNLEVDLSGQLRRCHSAWPSISISVSVFLPYLAERITDPSANTLSELHITDLYLACGCSQSDHGALAAFEARFLPEIDAALGLIRATPEQKREIKQGLLAQFFVGTPSSGPTIAAYTGRGPFGRWIRVSAARAGYRLVERERRAGGGQEELLRALRAPGDGPELALLKAEYGRDFNEAFEKALGTLDARERVFLRMHYVDGLSIDDIAPVFRVHRATVARRIAKAREDLFFGTRRALMSRLHIPRDEVSSILRLVRSQVRLPLSQLLTPVDPANPLPSEDAAQPSAEWQ